MPTLSSETVAADVWCRLIVARCGLTFRDAQIPVVLGKDVNAQVAHIAG